MHRRCFKVVTTTDVDSITFDKDAGFKVTASEKDVTVGLEVIENFNSRSGWRFIAGAPSITPSDKKT